MFSSADNIPAYGHWFTALSIAGVLLVFAFGFVRPKTSRDWRSFGAFSAFIVALFAEMYGFPLTIYLFSGPLSRWFPKLDLLTHNSGHLLEDFLGWGGDPHMSPFHILSYILIGYGFILLIDAWKVLYKAQQEQTLATAGPYARMRHPQYAAFILIMIGFLFQWPTLLTVLMFPVLTVMYIRLARREEWDALERFGTVWQSYAAATPAFVPRLQKRSQTSKK